MKPNAYIKFLELIDQQGDQFNLLDSTEKQLLNNIMREDHVGSELLVGDMLRLNLIGSQATIHGRLKNLVAIGYIRLIEQDDARKKRIMPTHKAYQLFKMLSACILQAKKVT